MTRWFRAALSFGAGVLFLNPALAQNADEPPQALITAAAGGQILRAGAALPLSAKPGEILFSGDALRADGAAVTFISCSANSENTLSPDADVLFELKAPKLRAGKFTGTKTVPGCFLPPMPRSIIASQQHAGASIAQDATRELSTQTFQQRLAALPEPQRSQLTAALAPVDAAIQANPADNVSHLARAAILERYGLTLDAAEEMRRVSQAWPDAGWTKSRLFV